MYLKESDEGCGRTEDSYCILVDFDMLVDTRLGTIARINPDCIEELLLSKKYEQRAADVFSRLVDNFNDKEYFEAYKKRDIETLKLSYLTNYSLLLMFSVPKDIEKFRRLQTYNSYYIDIDFGKYDLPQEVKEEYLNVLREALPLEVFVKGVSYNPSELSPAKLAENMYAEYVVYDFKSWVETIFYPMISEKELERQRYPLLKVITPFLFNPEMTEEQIKTILNESEVPPHVIMRESLSTHFNVEFVPAYMGSVQNAITLPTKKDYDIMKEVVNDWRRENGLPEEEI